MTERRFSRNSRKSASPSGSPSRGGKRRRILDAATHVFARQGFHDAHITHIAKAAGVADGTIYLYFENKEALLLSLFHDSITHLFEVMDREVAGIESPAAKLRRIIHLQLGLLERERALAAVITVHMRQSPHLKEQVAPTFNSYLEGIARIIADGQTAGDFRDDVPAMVVARAIFGAMDGITLTWALGRGDTGGLVKAADGLCKVFLEGLTVR